MWNLFSLLFNKHIKKIHRLHLASSFPPRLFFHSLTRRFWAISQQKADINRHRKCPNYFTSHLEPGLFRSLSLSLSLCGSISEKSLVMFVVSSVYEYNTTKQFQKCYRKYKFFLNIFVLWVNRNKQEELTIYKENATAKYDEYAICIGISYEAFININTKKNHVETKLGFSHNYILGLNEKLFSNYKHPSVSFLKSRSVCDSKHTCRYSAGNGNSATEVNSVVWIAQILSCMKLRVWSD